jgi:hypothetical protein
MEVTRDGYANLAGELRRSSREEHVIDVPSVRATAEQNRNMSVVRIGDLAVTERDEIDRPLLVDR